MNFPDASPIGKFFRGLRNERQNKKPLFSPFGQGVSGYHFLIRLLLNFFFGFFLKPAARRREIFAEDRPQVCLAFAAE
jgi:hypothetical protein